MENLRKLLLRLDGKSYGAYKSIKGTFNFKTYRLTIHHVQGDPFAAPSKLAISLPDFWAETYASSDICRTAVCDFLLRRLNHRLRTLKWHSKGSGKSGRVEILQPGQEVFFQTAVTLSKGMLTVRFKAGLPAFGRRIASNEAVKLLFEDLPNWINAISTENIDKKQLLTHVETIEDAEDLRSQLSVNGLIGFVANGANLARHSGADDSPLPSGIRFQSPKSREVTLQLPHRTITGMGLAEGVHLIVGGGFHGKSTLLNALQYGVYNHIPGDGREFVVTVHDALKIRSEDGRPVTKVNISAFINNLPGNADTTRFSTANASGSTSQATNLLEGLEMGATTLLMDEDTSATNFMIRDLRMQELVPKENEPITPFLDKVRQLSDQLGVSTILVVGGSGGYLAYADYVTCMINYEPHDYTENARRIVARHHENRQQEGGVEFGDVVRRKLNTSSIRAEFKGKRRMKTNGCDYLQIGSEIISLKFVEQLRHPGQVMAIGRTLLHISRINKQVFFADHLKTFQERFLLQLAENGDGDMVAFRPIELASAINRYARLEIASVDK